MELVGVDRSRLWLCGLFLAFAMGLCSNAAIAQVAPGVTQSAAHTANIHGTIVQSDGKPLAGADVKLFGPAMLATRSDDRGAFIFTSVPWGTYSIVVSSSSGTASKQNISVTADINVAVQYQAHTAGLKTIAEVSTSGLGAHINVTSSSIASVSPGDFAFQGNTTWGQLLAQVPGVAVSGYAGGGGSTYMTVPGNPLAPAVLSLNGALAYETSTTLDGMPLQGTSATEIYQANGGGLDLSNLPMNAFDTADVVRGPGANAPSIVDSVGGSFVLHAPGPVKEDHFEFSTSNDPYGGIVSNAKYAFHLGHLSMTLIYGINDSPGPLGTTNNELGGIYWTPTSINGTPVVGSTTTSDNPARGIYNCNCTFKTSLLYCCVPQSTAWTSQTGAAALSYDITPSIIAQVFYAGSSAKSNYQFGYYPTEFAPSTAGPPYTGSYHPSPPGQNSYSILNIFSTGDLTPQSSSLVEERLTAYFKNSVLRISALQNNQYTYTNYYFSFPNGDYRLWGTANLGSSSSSTPATFNGTIARLVFPAYSQNYYAWVNNRDLLGSYAVQLGGNSSAGASFSNSYYNDPYSSQFFLGKQALFSVSQPSSVSEDTYETRLHVDTTINKLALGLSWYFANGTFHNPAPSNPNQYVDLNFPYSAPRFGATWQASPDIAIRASAGGGFALPAIFNLAGTPIISVGSYYTQTVPNPNLKPEESFGYDIGTDMRFHLNTVLSFDLYQTNLYGQFFTTSSTTTYKGLPLYSYEYSNLGRSRMEGLNLSLSHDVPAGYYWGGTLGFTRGYVVSVPPGFYNGVRGYPAEPCTNCVNQTIVPGANFTNASGYQTTVPYASGSGRFGYKWSPGRFVDLAATYYGNNNIYNTPKVFVVLDAHAGYAFTKNVSLLATFRNITGAYDESVANNTPGYAVPVIDGAPPAIFPGAAFILPYGPRTVVVTANFKY